MLNLKPRASKWASRWLSNQTSDVTTLHQSWSDVMLIVNVTSRSEVGEVNELAMSSANYARIDQSTPNPRLIVYSVKTKILFVRG